LAFSAASTPDLAGNWKGTLDAGQVKLRLLFKITKSSSGGWAAKMDSLDQGARDIQVDTVSLKDNQVRMEVKKIQGVYTGTLDKAGNKLTGEWNQADHPMPLNLERVKGPVAVAEAENLSPEDLAASKQAAQKVIGTWNGKLAEAGANLRLVLKFTKAPSGATTGTMDSLDQGAKDIPLTVITLKENKLHFEAHGIGGDYEGTLTADGAALSGEWHQGGQAIPLNFKKGAAKE
jgi:hypothetical protein